MKKKHHKKVPVQKQNVQLKKMRTIKPVLQIFLKALFVVFLFAIVICYIDIKGYFNPNESNNHTKRKWNSFYNFSEHQDVDILMLGNSHLYSGINPKNLSNALGCNAFILASPGTHIGDSYYGLKEALKHSSAKLVVIETYGINNFNPYELKDGALSDQFKSFYARKDLVTKILSLPFLFEAKNYFYALSNTLRNHDFIFNDTTQLAVNKKLMKQRKKKNKKLYLGRYVRFQTGIEQDVLDKYDSLGEPVQGKEYIYSSYSEHYVDKIVDLCQKEGVELIFLTLPMYKGHISDYPLWQKKLAELLDKYSSKWINMQQLPHYNGFDTFAFENTYSQNQHMTYNGSILATYKLAHFIKDSLQVDLADRTSDSQWHRLFYGEEGYFENYNVSASDNNNKLICSNKSLQNIKLNSFLHLDINKKNNKILAKVDKVALKGVNYKNLKLSLLIKFKLKGKEKIASVDLVYDQFHIFEDEAIFMNKIKPLEIVDVVDGAIIKI